jgi:hypothetical protein
LASATGTRGEISVESLPSVTIMVVSLYKEQVIAAGLRDSGNERDRIELLFHLPAHLGPVEITVVDE